MTIRRFDRKPLAGYTPATTPDVAPPAPAVSSYMRALKPTAPQPCARAGCNEPRYKKSALCYAHLQQRNADRDTRAMTARECSLNAAAEHLPSMTLVWHQNANGEYVGFEGCTPDGLRVTVQPVDTPAVERGEGE